jgi:hypothetical protein
MTSRAGLWRVFPWDPSAADGAVFSPSFVPEPTGRGRFDLPSRRSPVLYLAESPAHAVAELLHPWRGRSIDDRHLTRAGRRLAVVEVTWSAPTDDIADLCDPETLVRLDVAPDRVASRQRSITQPIAQRVWDSGSAGLRWWSRFWGDWHATVVFTARAGVSAGPHLLYGESKPLGVEAPEVMEAAELLGIARGVG